MDSKRQVESRGPTSPLQPRRHQDTEEIHEPLVVSVPPRLSGLSALEVADGNRNNAAALSPCLRFLPGLRVLWSHLQRWGCSGSERDHSLNTLVTAALGSPRNVSAGTEIRRILYGKVPAVRLRTWPHVAADDDHPVGKDELPLRRRRLQEELAAPDPGRPRLAAIFVEGAAGKTRER